MGTYSKPSDLRDAQLVRFQKLNVTIRQGHKMVAEEGLKDAMGLTSGSLMPRQTAGAFARSQGGVRRTGRNGSAPLLPINKQSGRLHASMVLMPTATGRKQEFELTQDNPGGGIFRLLPGGTIKMVDSGFFKEIKKRWKARNNALLEYIRSKSKA